MFTGFFLLLQKQKKLIMATTNSGNSGTGRPQLGRDPLTYPVQTITPQRPGFIKEIVLQNRNLSRSVDQKQPQRAVEMNSMNKMNSIDMKPINVAPIGNSLGSGNGIDLSGEIKNSNAAQIMKNQKEKK